jgi:hypothetical protein
MHTPDRSIRRHLWRGRPSAMTATSSFFEAPRMSASIDAGSHVTVPETGQP